MLDTIANEVAAGKRVGLPGFGTFQRKFRGARTGRNPKTGEALEIAAKFTPKFTPSGNLKELCNPE